MALTRQIQTMALLRYGSATAMVDYAPTYAGICNHHVFVYWNNSAAVLPWWGISFLDGAGRHHTYFNQLKVLDAACCLPAP